MNIFVLNTEEGIICLNSDNEENDQILIDQGAIKLTDEEVERYGMKGYEQYVSPESTVVNEDGTIKFTPPDKETIDNELMDVLRVRRNMLIAKTDYLLTADYPIDEETLIKVKEYRQKLRDMTKLEGAPWDGGGPKTPWPTSPI